MRKRTRKRNNSKVKRINFSFITDMKHAKIVFSVVLLLVIIGFFSVVFAVVNIPNTNIIQGVYINNVDVSNMSKEDIKNSFNEILDEKKYNGVNITHNGEEYVLELGLLEITNNLNQILDEASKLGRSGNIIKDNYEIIKTFLFKKN